MKRMLLILVVCFAIGLTACSKTTVTNNQSHNPDRIYLSNNADGVVTGCDHGNRLYEDEDNHGIAVVPQDPSCRG